MQALRDDGLTATRDDIALVAAASMTATGATFEDCLDAYH